MRGREPRLPSMLGWPNLPSKDWQCAVIPCASLKSARAAVRWAKLGQTEKIITLAKLIHGVRTGVKNSRHYCGNDAECAAAVLAVVEGSK